MDDNLGFWEKSAGLYSIQEKKDKGLYDEIALLASQYLNKTKTILELGCGTGQLALRLKDNAKSYEATDFSKAMIKHALKREIKGASFKVMDATALEYEDESFDTIIIANVLHIVPEPEKILLEAYRVLKPGGLLIAPTFIYDDEPSGLRMKVLSLAGFKVFTKWSTKEFQRFIRNHGFKVLETKKIPGKTAGNLFLVGKKL